LGFVVEDLIANILRENTPNPEGDRDEGARGEIGRKFFADLNLHPAAP